MIDSPKILAAIFGAMVMVSSVTAGVVSGKCSCAAMNSTNPNDMLVEQSLSVGLPCNEGEDDQCKRMCIALTNTVKADGDGENQFCDKFGKDGLVNVHVFSKQCDRDYIYTGIASEKLICCKDKHSVPCQ